RAGLMAGFALSELQAQAILEMRLQRLTSLERDKIVEEYAETEKAIQRYRAILADEREIWKIITEELRELRAKYADPRRTQIVDEAAASSVEDLLVEEDMVVTISNEGYIKRNAVALYRAQRRGGRGKIGATTRDEDFVEHLFVASTHSYLLFFTTSGNVYWLKVHEIPQAGRAARGRSITNMLSLKPEEKLSAFLPVREFQEGRYVVFATRRGLVKKTDLMQYASPRPSGIITMKTTDKTGRVIGVRMVTDDDQIMLITSGGKVIRLRVNEIRVIGRNTQGVRLIGLEEGERVASVARLAEREDEGEAREEP